MLTETQEAETLLFLQQHSVRVPKLYAVYVENGDWAGSTGRTDAYFLVMEYIEGQKLEMDFFHGLDSESQTALAARTTEQYQRLRSIPQEPDHGEYYGHINYKGLPPITPFLLTYGKDMCGPYKTYADMVSDMLKSFERDISTRLQDDKHWGRDCEYLSRFTDMLRNSTYIKPTLTHMEPSAPNFVVRPIDNADGEGKKDWEVVLIDWESCGWMPAYMQAVVFDASMFDLDRERRIQFIQRILGPWDHIQAEMDVFDEMEYERDYTFV